LFVRRLSVVFGSHVLEMNERTGVVITVSSPSFVADLLADVDREIADHAANVAIILVDNGGVLRVQNGAVGVGGQPPRRLSHLRAASFDVAHDGADAGDANVFVLKPVRNLGWRDGMRAGTAWLLGNLPDVGLVAISNDDIRLSPDFFGTMERTFQAVSAATPDRRVILAPLYDFEFNDQLTDFLGPADAFPDAGRVSWRRAGVVDGTFQFTSRRGAEKMILPGMADLGSHIPWVNDKLIELLSVAPLESVPFLQTAFKLGSEISHVDALRRPLEAGAVAVQKAAQLLEMMTTDERYLLRGVLINGAGKASHGVVAVAEGAYINHVGRATHIEEIRVEDPALRDALPEVVFVEGLLPKGLKDETADFARLRVAVGALAKRLSVGASERQTPTRMVVDAFARVGVETGACAELFKEPVFGGIAHAGFTNPDSNIRKRLWLQQHPQFRQLGIATPGAA
jgi:hypothetical protein